MPAETPLPQELENLRNLKIPEASRVIGLCAAKIHQLIASGRLRSLKIDGARRIPVSAVKEFLAAQDGS